MFYPNEIINLNVNMLCDAYRKDRMRLAERERLIRSFKINKNFSNRFSCIACKMLFKHLVSPLYHRMKRQIEAAA